MNAIISLCPIVIKKKKHSNSKLYQKWSPVTMTATQDVLSHQFGPGTILKACQLF